MEIENEPQILLLLNRVA
ncbi:hypothetical protein WN66_06851 [Saccharomyces cerevisiae]|nr:hypothetical protein WN66_06851 [Saccharomyces cerevisiae]